MRATQLNALKHVTNAFQGGSPPSYPGGAAAAAPAQAAEGFCLAESCGVLWLFMNCTQYDEVGFAHRFQVFAALSDSSAGIVMIAYPRDPS